MKYQETKIMAKHKARFNLDAAHDVIYVAHITTLPELTDENVIYMCRCGIHLDEMDCLSLFC